MHKVGQMTVEGKTKQAEKQRTCVWRRRWADGSSRLEKTTLSKVTSELKSEVKGAKPGGQLRKCPRKRTKLSS